MRKPRPAKQGLSAICRDCSLKQSVAVNSWYASAAPRCKSCGGQLDRIHERGKFRYFGDGLKRRKSKSRNG